jgi:uncharacterized protein (DUF39 family)
MGSCDENKGINVRIVDMSFRTRLVPMRRRLNYRTRNFGKITPFINKTIKN